MKVNDGKAPILGNARFGMPCSQDSCFDTTHPTSTTFEVVLIFLKVKATQCSSNANKKVEKLLLAFLDNAKLAFFFSIARNF